jgi:hypothetical protein
MEGEESQASDTASWMVTQESSYSQPRFRHNSSFLVSSNRRDAAIRNVVDKTRSSTSGYRPLKKLRAGGCIHRGVPEVAPSAFQRYLHDYFCKSAGFQSQLKDMTDEQIRKDAFSSRLKSSFFFSQTAKQNSHVKEHEARMTPNNRQSNTKRNFQAGMVN